MIHKTIKSYFFLSIMSDFLLSEGEFIFTLIFHVSLKSMFSRLTFFTFLKLKHYLL